MRLRLLTGSATAGGGLRGEGTGISRSERGSCCARRVVRSLLYDRPLRIESGGSSKRHREAGRFRGQKPQVEWVVGVDGSRVGDSDLGGGGI